VVACVDVQAAADGSSRSVASEVLWNLAVRRVEGCIRPDDLMCMLGGSRVVVCFGNGVHRIAPDDLGTRLARAMGSHLAVGSSQLGLKVSVGVCAGGVDVNPAALAEAAIASTRVARGRTVHSARNGAHSGAVVSVTHVPEAREPVPGARPLVGDVRPESRTGRGRPRHRLARRVLLPMPDDPDSPADAAVANGTAPAVTSRTARPFRPAAPPIRVLVVDPGASSDGPPRPAVHGVVAVANGLGARAVLSLACDPDPIVADALATDADAVLLTLHAEPHVCEGSSLTLWEQAARITRALTLRGTHVIALRINASAAAVAACVEQGASGLLDIDSFGDELVALARMLAGNAESAPRPAGGRNGANRIHRSLPVPYGALVHLTSSERKVLFQMMEGRSAGDIADALTVSLSTVRSHIRAILRKLNVNSQLAAVAIANGVRLEATPDRMAVRPTG